MSEFTPDEKKLQLNPKQEEQIAAKNKEKKNKADQVVSVKLSDDQYQSRTIGTENVMPNNTKPSASHKVIEKTDTTKRYVETKRKKDLAPELSPIFNPEKQIEAPPAPMSREYLNDANPSPQSRPDLPTDVDLVVPVTDRNSTTSQPQPTPIKNTPIKGSTPRWIANSQRPNNKFKIVHLHKNNLNQTLDMLMSNNTIKSYQETSEGFKAYLSGDCFMNIHFKNQEISLHNPSEMQLKEFLHIAKHFGEVQRLDNTALNTDEAQNKDPQPVNDGQQADDDGNDREKNEAPSF